MDKVRSFTKESLISVADRHILGQGDKIQLGSPSLSNTCSKTVEKMEIVA